MHIDTSYSTTRVFIYCIRVHVIRKLFIVIIDTTENNIYFPINKLYNIFVMAFVNFKLLKCTVITSYYTFSGVNIIQAKFEVDMKSHF